MNEQLEQQQFVLRWHFHDATLINNLPGFLENDILTDVILSVGAQQFRAHKLILAMCSAYFFQLFQEINTQHPVVVLHNVSTEDVRAILAFIYKGQCVVTKEHLPGLLSVAKLLKIQGLCDMKVPEKHVQTDVNEQAEQNNINEISKICDSIPDNTVGKQVNDKPKLNVVDNVGGGAGGVNVKRHNSMLWDKPNSTNATERNDSQSERAGGGGGVKKSAANCNKDSSETCKCFLCGKYLSNQYNLRVHMETHEEAFHACQSCPHVSRSRDALRKHVSYRHPEEYHTRKRKKTIDNP